MFVPSLSNSQAAEARVPSLEPSSKIIAQNGFIPKDRSKAEAGAMVPPILIQSFHSLH